MLRQLDGAGRHEQGCQGVEDCCEAGNALGGLESDERLAVVALM